MSSSIVWSWKQEPASPPQLYEQESWYSSSDNVAVEVELTDDLKASRAEHASKLLRDLDQWVKEEEPFPDWLEEKIDLPIFDDLPPPSSLMNNLDIVGLKPSSPLVNPGLDMTAMKPSQINACPLDTVTMKPHTQPPSVVNNGIEIVGMKPLLPLNPLQYHIPPPPPALPIEQTPVQLMQEFDYSLSTHDTLTPPESPHSTELVFTMLQEMQPHELDELVRMRVESLVEAPAMVVTSPQSSIQEEIESIASPSSDSGYSDPEWTCAASTSYLKSPKRRRAMKPYSRTPPEEKRLRKKEQNKNAATRYRLKKKQEVEDILGEEKELQQRNEHLKSELTEIGREIKYLKNLMRDMFKAKGLIK